MKEQTERKHTPGPWVVDDGLVTMRDQAELIKADIGTNREWTAIGKNDEEGFAEVVSLSHPANALLIAAAPELLEACQTYAQLVNNLGVALTSEQISEATVALTKHSFQVHFLLKSIF